MFLCCFVAMAKTIIIGNGISGITTARHLRKLKANEEIIIVSSETKHFYSRTALMYVYMGHMKFEHTKPYEDSFWEKNRLQLKFGHVKSIDFERNTILFTQGDELIYDKLVLALGSKTILRGWKGENLKGVLGLYSCQDLLELEELSLNVEQAVIVGGGLIGVELAEMLISRDIKVHFIIKENHFWGNVLNSAEGHLILNHLRAHGVVVETNSYLKEIHGEHGRVTHITTGKDIIVKCGVVGITTGVEPNIEFLKNSKLECDRGILIDKTFKTNMPNVFALGDCAQFIEPPKGRRPIEQTWYTGRMMGEVLAQNLAGNRLEYSPGPWFNSAKFFDIEYQTYGVVPSVLSENQRELLWQSDSKNQLVRMVFDTSNHSFLGINTFGIRMRHAAFDAWLRNSASIHEVLKGLANALFEPEFSNTPLRSIVTPLANQLGTTIEPEAKSWRKILKFSSNG
jgi:NADPH-dependent 2,4-dienoyl-CoA reductase/sulfur reductase-like enzyme